MNGQRVGPEALDRIEQDACKDPIGGESEGEDVRGMTDADDGSEPDSGLQLCAIPKRIKESRAETAGKRRAVGSGAPGWRRISRAACSLKKYSEYSRRIPRATMRSTSGHALHTGSAAGRPKRRRRTTKTSAGSSTSHSRGKEEGLRGKESCRRAASAAARAPSLLAALTPADAEAAAAASCAASTRFRARLSTLFGRSRGRGACGDSAGGDAGVS